MKNYKVFLSAGHGGDDSGAVYRGLREKDINLQILLECRSVLQRHGIIVFASRLKDENDRVHEEVREANASGADLAISFHINAGKGDGCEFYIWETNELDEKIAKLCEKHLNAIGQNSRKPCIKSGNHLYWCRNTKMTSCLAESFFIDNDTDNDIGYTIEEMKAIGKAYAKAILEFFNIKYVPDDAEKYCDISLLARENIISNEVLWRMKSDADKNIYWIIKKMADYIRGK